MSYEKTNWQTGDTITADKLNNIESGIENLDGRKTMEVVDLTCIKDSKFVSGWGLEESTEYIMSKYESGDVVFRISGDIPNIFARDGSSLLITRVLSGGEGHILGITLVCDYGTFENQELDPTKPLEFVPYETPDRLVYDLRSEYNTKTQKYEISSIARNIYTAYKQSRIFRVIGTLPDIASQVDNEGYRLATRVDFPNTYENGVIIYIDDGKFKSEGPDDRPIFIPNN